jgi:hypothetical protein
MLQFMLQFSSVLKDTDDMANVSGVAGASCAKMQAFVSITMQILQLMVKFVVHWYCYY